MNNISFILNFFSYHSCGNMINLLSSKGEFTQYESKCESDIISKTNKDIAIHLSD